MRRWVFIDDGGSTLAYSVSTTNETVVDGVRQSNGTITFTVSGGTGPYTVHNENGYGDISGPGPDFTFTGLDGGAFADYSFYITDSAGGLVPSDWPVSSIMVHVYRDAFDWHVTQTQSHIPILYNAADVHSFVSPAFLKFNPFSIGFASPVLTSVDATIVGADLTNRYTVLNSAAPVSHHYDVSASTSLGMKINGTQWVSGSIVRPTQSGSTTLASTPVFGPPTTTVSNLTTNITDAPTLAALTGAGTITVEFTSTLPIIDTTGSDPQITATLPGAGTTCSWIMSVVYNYHCPQE